MSGSGISAMIQMAAKCENDLGLTTLSIGRSSDPNNDRMLEIGGDHLMFTITLIKERILVAAQVMDRPDPPDFFLKIEDSPEGRTLCPGWCAQWWRTKSARCSVRSVPEDRASG